MTIKNSIQNFFLVVLVDFYVGAHASESRPEAKEEAILLDLQLLEKQNNTLYAELYQLPQQPPSTPRPSRQPAADLDSSPDPDPMLDRAPDYTENRDFTIRCSNLPYYYVTPPIPSKGKKEGTRKKTVTVRALLQNMQEDSKK